mmetsp:Transcript_10614/g.18640  ORF Transcript_10614/g.18640 Transcript_10614/m.18640 type:complete len:135 (-) Transcript_10614:178-582(-)
MGSIPEVPPEAGADAEGEEEEGEEGALADGLPWWSPFPSSFLSSPAVGLVPPLPLRLDSDDTLPLVDDSGPEDDVADDLEDEREPAEDDITELASDTTCLDCFSVASANDTDIGAERLFVPPPPSMPMSCVVSD